MRPDFGTEDLILWFYLSGFLVRLVLQQTPPDYRGAIPLPVASWVNYREPLVFESRVILSGWSTLFRVKTKLRIKPHSQAQRPFWTVLSGPGFANERNHVKMELHGRLSLQLSESQLVPPREAGL